MKETVIVLIILGIVTGLFLLGSWIVRWRRWRSSAGEMFYSLCRAHRLRWKECWWLWQLARGQQIADPGRLFLEPERFEESQIPAALRPRLSQLQNLQERLFFVVAEKTSRPPMPQSAMSRESPPPGLTLPVLDASPKLDISPWTTATVDSPSIPI
jgi:hypothetical protein